VTQGLGNASNLDMVSSERMQALDIVDTISNGFYPIVTIGEGMFAMNKSLPMENVQ
jgi:hypothetical protein